MRSRVRHQCQGPKLNKEVTSPLVTQEDFHAKKKFHLLRSLSLAETALFGLKPGFKMDGSNGITLTAMINGQTGKKFL